MRSPRRSRPSICAADETDLEITAPPVFTARWLMPRLADFARREPKIDVRVVASSKMVDAGALDSAVLASTIDLRSDTSGVRDPPRRWASIRAIAPIGSSASRRSRWRIPELVQGRRRSASPRTSRGHTLLHDDAMDLVAHGHAWQKWLEVAGVADKVDGTRGPHFSSQHPVARGRVAEARRRARAASAGGRRHRSRGACARPSRSS